MAHSNSNLEHAAQLTRELEKHPNGERTVAVNQEMQRDREKMTPQEYNQLLRDMQTTNQADRSKDSNLPEIHIYSNYKDDVMAGITKAPQQLKAADTADEQTKH